MGKIKVTPCDIKGLYVIEPTVFKDERGYFMETYNQNDFHEAGLDMVFVQDNQSMSVKGVLRGLHYQKQYPQGKLVRAVRGTVFDVAVDLRTGSERHYHGICPGADNLRYFQSLRRQQDPAHRKCHRAGVHQGKQLALRFRSLAGSDDFHFTEYGAHRQIR